MSEAWYKYKELITLNCSDEVFVIIRSKHRTEPNGKQNWYYQLEDSKGELYKHNDGSWFSQSQLKKILIPSVYSFEGLKVVLNGVVERGDWE